ncbi:MAG TPA: phosphodiester glycosidase family protein [Bacteroidota bacterium]|nr:phosphodiester glycosidase family protein [Bacteroidota bacterium]
MNRALLSLTILLCTACTRLVSYVPPGSGNAEAPREKYCIVTQRTVCPGVWYYFLADKRGPWQIHVLEIDLRNPDLTITAARAGDRLFGREQTSSMASRLETPGRTVVAALNGDFFSLTTGENENNCVIDTDFVKGTKMTGSPYDTFDNIHSQFAMSSNRRPALDRFEFMGKVFLGKTGTIDLLGVNDAPKPKSVVLFNRWFGPSTPTDTIRMSMTEVSIRLLGRTLDTLVAVVKGTSGSGGSPIDSTTCVLCGYDLPAQHPLKNANIGDTIRVWLGVSPGIGIPRTIVGGWPRIVLNGKNIGPLTDSIEGTFPTFSAQRNPRTGIGFSADSTTVFLFAVDGRQKMSAGMTLKEFADAMIFEGVYQGLNLDGGGSTTFVLQGKVMNLPSDATGERPVGNCILLTAPIQK